MVLKDIVQSAENILQNKNCKRFQFCKVILDFENEKSRIGTFISDQWILSSIPKELKTMDIIDVNSDETLNRFLIQFRIKNSERSSLIETFPEKIIYTNDFMLIKVISDLEDYNFFRLSDSKLYKLEEVKMNKSIKIFYLYKGSYTAQERKIRKIDFESQAFYIHNQPNPRFDCSPVFDSKQKRLIGWYTLNGIIPSKNVYDLVVNHLK